MKRSFLPREGIPSLLQSVAELLGCLFTFSHPKLNFYLQNIILKQKYANPMHLLGPRIGRKILQSHFQVFKKTSSSLADE